MQTYSSCWRDLHSALFFRGPVKNTFLFEYFSFLGWLKGRGCLAGGRRGRATRARPRPANNHFQKYADQDLYQENHYEEGDDEKAGEIGEEERSACILSKVS